MAKKKTAAPIPEAPSPAKAPPAVPEKPAAPRTSWDPKTNRVIHHRDEG